MPLPTLEVTGIAHVDLSVVRECGDGRRNVRITFLDGKGRTMPKGLSCGGLQISDWHLQEGIYDRCDTVRVLDANADGGQLEFGRFTIQFLHAGALVGEHIADAVTIHSGSR